VSAQDSMPLRWPEGYPPKRGMEKFFLGVRWLGPDLSFFRDLKALQAARKPGQMAAWGGGKRQAIAERIAGHMQRGLKWPTAVFLPEDSWQVICNGPKFDMFDDFVAVEAIDDFQDHYQINVPGDFWENRDASTFGEVVDDLALLPARRST
jgi:hypothetical protein